MVYDKDPGLLFVAIDFEEDHYDIEAYKQDFPHNKVVGPIEPPKGSTYDPMTTPEQRAALLDVAANNPLMSQGLYAILKDLERAEAALGVERISKWQTQKP
jgi:hypothetical protein